MTIQELRIGNYVSVPHFRGGRVNKRICNLYYDPNTNEQKIAVQYYDQDMFYGNYPMELTEPIPLTPELLEKAGFDRGFLDINGQTIYVDPERKESSVGGYDACTGGHTFNIDNFQFLHQLQNLYFALTGEELMIDL